MIGSLVKLDLLQHTTIKVEVGPAKAELALVRKDGQIHLDLRARSPEGEHNHSHSLDADAGTAEKIKYVAPMLRSAMDIVGAYQSGSDAADGVNVNVAVRDENGGTADRTFRLPVEKNQLMQLIELVNHLRSVNEVARAASASG